MPAKLTKIEGSGAIALEHTCDTCGKPAYFGVGVSFNKALIMHDKGKIERAKEFLGKWYCLICWRALK